METVLKCKTLDFICNSYKIQAKIYLSLKQTWLLLNESWLASNLQIPLFPTASSAIRLIASKKEHNKMQYTK